MRLKLYLIVFDASEKWTMPMRKWGIMVNQLKVYSGESRHFELSSISSSILDLFAVSLGRTALKKILKLLWQARTEQLHVYR